MEGREGKIERGVEFGGGAEFSSFA